MYFESKQLQSVSVDLHVHVLGYVLTGWLSVMYWNFL